MFNNKKTPEKKELRKVLKQIKKEQKKGGTTLYCETNLAQSVVEELRTHNFECIPCYIYKTIKKSTDKVPGYAIRW